MSGPSHPSIQAEVRRAKGSVRVRVVVSLVLAIALCGCLARLPELVGWLQQTVRTEVVPRLPVDD